MKDMMSAPEIFHNMAILLIVLLVSLGPMLLDIISVIWRYIKRKDHTHEV